MFHLSVPPFFPRKSVAARIGEAERGAGLGWAGQLPPSPLVHPRIRARSDTRYHLLRAALSAPRPAPRPAPRLRPRLGADRRGPSRCHGDRRSGARRHLHRPAAALAQALRRPCRRGKGKGKHACILLNKLLHFCACCCILMHCEHFWSVHFMYISLHFCALAFRV